MTEQDLQEIERRYTTLCIWDYDRMLMLDALEVPALIAEVRRLRGVVEELHRTYDPLDYCENHKDDCHGYCRRCDKWKYRGDKEATDEN